MKLNDNITNTLHVANNDIRKADLGSFYRLVTELDHINSTTNAPRINEAVSTLIAQSSMKPETIQKYQVLLQVTQQFTDNIRF